jgi:hypothetical protein
LKNVLFFYVFLNPKVGVVKGIVFGGRSVFLL